MVGEAQKKVLAEELNPLDLFKEDEFCEEFEDASPELEYIKNEREINAILNDLYGEDDWVYTITGNFTTGKSRFALDLAQRYGSSVKSWVDFAKHVENLPPYSTFVFDDEATRPELEGWEMEWELRKERFINSRPHWLNVKQAFRRGYLCGVRSKTRR